SDFVQQEHTICDFSSSNSWVILSPIEQSIKRKIEAIGTPLKDWDINIYRGVLTGYNDAFIISTEKRDRILANCQTEEERQRTAELIRPILRGRDIKRYGYEWAGLYLIATFPSRHYDIEMFPAVKAHLLSFGIKRLEQTGKTHIVNEEKVKARKKTNNKWFETQDSISYWEDFNKPKIMYPNMTKYMPFYYDEKGFYQNDKSFMITGKHISFLTAFFNSSLFKFCFRDNFPELLGGTRELRKIFFDKISVIKVSDKINNDFKREVINLQSNYTQEKAAKIDLMLFDLYNLTEEERKVIGNIEIK
ncbi:TaqI-like C-terminal specificity domain-containing protein, partial [Bacteroides fragilis]